MTCKKDKSQEGVASKDMAPLPENFWPVFFKNQFRTTIELPTKAEYPNVQGQCGIITGSNTGLGLEAARHFLSLGLSRLIMGIRSLQKGQEAAAELQKANPAAQIDVWVIDMGSNESIRAFVHRCQDETDRLDFAILNSGISPLTFVANEETGHEQTMQVNHFGTALLAVLLLPVLHSRAPETASPPHLTVVNSVTAHLCKLPNLAKRPFLASFDDENVPFDGSERYGASKLVSQFFLVKLSEKIPSNSVIINMVDPGLTKGTGLIRGITGVASLAVGLLFGIAGRPVNRGAATYVHAVLEHGQESHGCFLMNSEIAPLSKWYYKNNRELAEIVWTETIDSLGLAGEMERWN